MKTLKLDHTLAHDVLQGTKRDTWRLKDDKDLSVGDLVELIDRVEADRPETWRAIGQARIDQVVQKRLSAVTDEELAAHGYKSRLEMIEQFRGYYGTDVDAATPVKMLQFTFEPYAAPLVPAPHSVTHEWIKLYADGGSRGNPGPSASGYVLLDRDGNLIKKGGVYLGITTNNQAEYQALRFGLDDARELGAHEVEVYMDSLLVINQMKGIFKVRDRDLLPIHDAIKQQVLGFEKITFTHVPRALNKLADAEVNETLDAEAAK